MSTVAPGSRSDSALLAAGIALVVLPLAAIAIKIAWPGWMLFFVLFASPLLAIGYVVQVVAAVMGFFGGRALFRAGTARRRALIAAWLTSGGVLATGLFFVDGGDSSWGSSFMYLVGAASDPVLGMFSGVISIAAAIAWLGGWGWLVVEWIGALIRRRRSAEPHPSAPR